MSLVFLLSVVMIACKGKNIIDEEDITIHSEDTTIVATDTICITWNGSSATIEGSHDGVTITEQNGTVNVISTVKDLAYLLSGEGTGCLRIEGTNRHQLILSDLTLTCSDGPAINNQCHKKCYVRLCGANSLTDGSSYASSTEDRKAAFFSEGQMIFSGNGSLTAKSNYKHALASDDYILFAQSTGSLNLTAASDGIHANDGIYFDGGTFTINAGSEGIQCDTSEIVINNGSINVTAAGDKGMSAYGNITINGGTVRISSEYKCIKAGKKENNRIVSAGNITITGGDIQVICNGKRINSGGPGGGSSSTTKNSPEAIEAKGTITISGGYIYAQSADDAINSAGDMTVSGGCICAYSTGNDGLDANGNLYIKGGLIYAISATDPEVALDADERHKLYIQGGTIVALGKLERGASLEQSCYQNSTWNATTWYSITIGDETFAFKTPEKPSSSGGGPGGGSRNTPLVVSGSSKPTVKSGVTVNGGTVIFKEMGRLNASVSGGSSVTLSTYSSNNW